ncbi:FecR family protein [soil metagenome]|tara:strand:+ start:1732 stop:2685 length:954 start_codon:yes stop_codon:yes gene_type:complete
MTAPSDIDETRLDEALAWHAALESDDADWDGYIAWLEVDPRNRTAFDSIALVATMVDTHSSEVAQLITAQSRPSAYRRFMRPLLYAGGGIAASLAVMLAVPLVRTEERVATYAADAGRSQTVALANGISVTLSPSSRIVVHGKDASRIELAKGEAYFDVRHDPARVLKVSAGDYSISDIGTRFTVNIAQRAFRVGVAEGTITVAAAGADRPVTVKTGHELTADATNMTLSPVPVSNVGSWRSGRLSYIDAPLALVAGDIARYMGKPVAIDPSLEMRHFSGTLVIGDGTKLLSDFASVMVLRIQPEGRGFRVSLPPAQ